MGTSRFVRAGPILVGLFVLLVLAACENDPRPRAEPASRAPAAAPALAETAGMCGGEMPSHEGTACGCEGQHVDQPGAGPIVPITEAKVGDRTRCPVSHTLFTVRPNSPTLDYQGKTYHFCCANCVNRFQQDPASYLAS
jgi:YHS domain-containing protein